MGFPDEAVGLSMAANGVNMDACNRAAGGLSGLGRFVMAGLILVSGSGLAHAQAEEPGDPTGEDILVTAQRRPMAAREVAGSVDVLGERLLEATGTRDFEDIARVDPGVQLSAYQGETQLFVRGIGAVTFVGGFDSSVAVYADEVYLSRPAAITGAFFDLDRVEILKGPQGSLYGRNATGGAIKLVSRGPSDEWEGEARVTTGNYGRADGFAAIGGPVSRDLTFRLAVGTRNHDGYTRLDFGPDADGKRRIEHAEDRRDIIGRLTLDWTPSATVGLRLAGEYYRADDRAVVFHFAGPGYQNNPLFLARLAEGEVGPYRSRTINTSFRPFNKPENWALSAKVWTDLPVGRLTAITAWRRTHPYNLDDLSNSTILGESQFREERANQFSQELTLTSPGASAIGYVLGATYFRERNAIRNEYFFPFLVDYLGGTGAEDCCLLKANGSTRTRSYALFGEVDVPVARRLHAIVGAHWSRERRGGRNLLAFESVQTVNDAAFVPASFDAFTPKFGLRYKFRDAAQVYATVSRGFKSGGFNIGSTQNSAYRPERIWSYEIGGSARAAEGLEIKAAAFHYDYTDLQVQDVSANSVVIRNAATARVDGGELSARLDAAPGLVVEASGAYLDARFKDYRTVNLKTPELGVLDLGGNPLPNSPRFKGRLSGEYRFGFPRGLGASIRVDAMWQDRIYFSAFKDPRATQGAFAWIKARVAVEAGDHAYELAAFVDNLTDARTFTNISITGDLDASRANGVLAPPRTIGLSLSMRF
jgi:iron complex outermembrane receptor protein